MASRTHTVFRPSFDGLERSQAIAHGHEWRNRESVLTRGNGASCLGGDDGTRTHDPLLAKQVL
jgi:hypothetical protein